MSVARSVPASASSDCTPLCRPPRASVASCERACSPERGSERAELTRLRGIGAVGERCAAALGRAFGYPSSMSYELDAAADQSIRAAAAGLPDWVQELRPHLFDDSDGNMALAVVVVMRPGDPRVFTDGRLLNAVRDRIHEVVAQAGITVWPYVRFISADELPA